MFTKKKKVKREDLRGKTIDQVLAAIKKVHGADCIRRLDDKTIAKKVDVISTGSLWVDEALGVGGLPRGRVIEIYGHEGGGKTTLALHSVAEAQKTGGYALYIDAENAIDMPFAKRIGVKPELFMLSQPSSGEEGLDILDRGIASGKFAIAVVDSVSAITPQAELDGNVGDSHMGLQARLMGQTLRKISSNVAKTGTLVIFINQLRAKIGVFFGSNETTSGGNALKFFASIRIDIRRIGSIKKQDTIIGNKVKVKIVKNKLAPPFKEIETELIFGHGFSKESELLSMAEDLDVIDIKGRKYNYRDHLIGDTKTEAIENLKKKQKLFDSILTDVRIEKASKNED